MAFLENLKYLFRISLFYREEFMADEKYIELAWKMDKNMQGIPKTGENISPAFLKYIELLFSPEEAELALHLNLAPKLRPVSEIASSAGKDEAIVGKILRAMSDRGAVMRLGESYCLQLIPNFFNYLMFDDKIGGMVIEAGKLYQEFFIKDKFYKFYESSAAGTSIQRVVPVKQAIRDEKIILPAEDAHRLIDDYPGEDISLAACPCRSRTDKLGIRECKSKFPVGSCIFFGFQTIYLNQEGKGKRVTKAEAKKYMDKMVDLGLVISTENYADASRSVICLCCNCCCSMLRGITKWDNPRALARANFVAQVEDDCAACGTCESRCPVAAVSVPADSNKAVVNETKCLGCGVCAITCPTESLTLKRIDREHIFQDSKELFTRVRRENKS